MDTEKLKPPLAMVGLLAILIAAPFAVRTYNARTSPLERMGQLPTWQLTSQTNQPFGSAQLAGKPYITSFFFTSCPTICPKIMGAMAKVAAQTSDAIKLVSITVDPLTDTPEVLQASMAKYDAKAPRWTFCTGTELGVREVIVGGFKTYVGKKAAKSDNVYDIAHGARLVLVDGGGQVRGHFGTDDAGLAELVKAAKTLE